jgi:hypothetical protein
MSVKLLRRVQRQTVHEGLREKAQASDASLLLALAIIGGLSALVYALFFSLPYGLPQWFNWIHFDLQRLQLRDQDVHWPMLLALVAEVVLYWLAWQVVRRVRGRLAWAVVILGAVISAAALLPVYPFGSTDIYDYIMHGRMLGIYGANPFVKLASQFRYDLFYQYVGWPDAPSAYGPLWEIPAGWLAAAVNSRWGMQVIPNVIAFKLFVGLFLAGSAVVVAAILRRVSPERTLTGVLLLTWNPIILWETLGNGHNDIVMAFWILVATLAIIYRRYTLGILALLAGALVKFIPVLMLPAAAVLALRDLRTWRQRLSFLALTCGLGLLLITAAYAPFWKGPEVLSVGRRAQMFTTSLPTVIAFLLQQKMGATKAKETISMVAAGLTGIYALWEAYRAWGDRSWMSFARSAFDISIFYVLFTALWLWPWYAIWPLSLAVLFVDGRALLAQVSAVTLMAAPWLSGWMLLNHPGATPRWGQLRLAPSILALPWLYTLYLLATSILDSVGRLVPSRKVEE